MPTRNAEGAPAPSRASSPTITVRAQRSSHLRLRPRWTDPGEAFRHTWEGVLNIDQFRWLVRADVQEQLALAHQELGGRHVRAVGMYDDEMRVFCPSPGAFMGYEPPEPRTNWQMVDSVMDALLDRGLNPMFTTTFVPSALASGPLTVFSTKAHTSPPKDLHAWARLVQESVTHAVDRYALAVVRQWYFEVWNEPNLQGWFWGGDRDQFFQLWRATYDAIKAVDADFRVGGPSCARAEWIDELLEFGQRHGCSPDYVIGHIYNNDSSGDAALAPFAGAQLAENNTSPDAAINAIRSVRERLNRHGYRGEIHWNEWGRSFHGVDRRRETPAEAAFIVRLLAETSQQADAFAYWCLSDIYDQVGYGREAFHGGYGLLNLQGLRKPAYHAFTMLSRLGTRRIFVEGDGVDSFCHAIATAPQQGKAHLLIYGYEHEDSATTCSVDVEVDLPPQTRGVQLYRIDSGENNVVADWRALGSPAYLSRAQTAELAARNTLQASSARPRLLGHDGAVHAKFVMERPGLALLEIALD